MSVKFSDGGSVEAMTIGKWFFYGCAISFVVLNLREIVGAIASLA